MGLNLTNFAPMLKTIYTKEKVQNLTYKNKAFLAQLAKDEKFYGDSKVVPVIFGNPQGRSAAFATAQANKGNTQSIKFTITRSKDYQLLSIDNETIEASQNDAGAFASARTTEIDGGMDNISSALAIDLFGTGSGSRGQLSSAQNVALTVVTLENKQDIVKIEVNMPLVLSSADGGGSVRSGTMYVKSVDRKAGTFVVSATAGGAAAAISTCISAAAASDYVFVAGDYDAKVKGLAAWLPYGGPSATSFFGVDRTQDATRLGGVWDDLSGMPIDEALIEAAALMHREGSMLDKFWMHTTKMSDLIKTLGSKVQYVDAQVGQIGFRGVRVQTNDGVVDCFADRNCKSTSLFALQSNTWKLETLGSAPRILNMDSLEALREATSDGIEIRIGYYGQLSCNAPGYNGHFKI